MLCTLMNTFFSEEEFTVKILANHRIYIKFLIYPKNIFDFLDS